MRNTRRKTEGTTDGTTVHPADDLLDSTVQAPNIVPQNLAASYLEAARLIASMPEEALARYLPAEDDPRLDELRRFLMFVTGRWPTKSPFYFFPMMSESVRLLHRHHHLDGGFPEVLFSRLTSDWSPDGDRLIPLRMFCDYTTCGRGKARSFPALRRQMAKLLLLNALGYDIYGCPNPIAYGCRLQRTVPFMTNIVFESDEATLEAQMDASRRMEGFVGAVVFSGRRSLHMYFRLVFPIRNPHFLTPWKLAQLKGSDFKVSNGTNRWKHVMTLKRHRQLQPVAVDSWDYAADLLRGLIAERSNVMACPNTLFNFAGLSRVPGFAHTGTGERSKLIYLNPDAVYPTNSLGEPDNIRFSPFWRREFCIPDDEVYPLKSKGKASPIASVLSHIVDGPDSLGFQRDRDGDGDEDRDGNGKNDQANDRNDPKLASNGAQGSKGTKNSTPTDTKGVTLLPREASFTGRTFLDDLNEFKDLKTHGIPCRGKRRSLHRVVVNVALLRGWTRQQVLGGKTKVFLDGDRIADEWRTILALSGHSIGCSIEEGVNQIKGYVDVKNSRHADGHFSFAMPDCSLLPDLDKERRQSLRERVRRLLTEEASQSSALPVLPALPSQSVVTGMLNIIADVLYPMIRTHPGQCLGGCLSVQARNMKAKCTRGRYAPVRLWMRRLNLMRQTRSASQTAGLTRLYWVNIPLIIWLLGFEKADLAWERGSQPGRTAKSDTESGRDRASLANVSARATGIPL